jgi:UDP-glucuronate 4-epimerase
MMINGNEIPVHVDAPSVYHPLHQDDIIAMVPGLIAAAATPATTVNWGGEQAVSIEEWCGYLSELTGVAVKFSPTRDTIDSVQIDLTRMHEVVGTPSVGWRDGMRRMVEARHPELLGG